MTEDFWLKPEEKELSQFPKLVFEGQIYRTNRINPVTERTHTVNQPLKKSKNTKKSNFPALSYEVAPKGSITNHLEADLRRFECIHKLIKSNFEQRDG